MAPIWQRLNLEYLLTQFVAWLPSVISATIILVFFAVLFRFTRQPFSKLLERTGLDHALVRMIVNVYRFTLLVFGLIMAAGQLGINVGAALAGLGVAGLTIGFAAKDTLSNIISGFLIFWDKPFKVGDWVTVGDHYGAVAEITMRTTRVRTLNNTWVIIPNETVINQILVNHSTAGPIRLDVPVGIAYQAAIGEARRALLERLSSIGGVLRDPAPKVAVKNLADSSVELTVQLWIADAGQEQATKFAVLEASKAALDAAGIEIPYPHVQLLVDGVQERVWRAARELMVVAAPNGSTTR